MILQQATKYPEKKLWNFVMRILDIRERLVKILERVPLSALRICKILPGIQEQNLQKWITTKKN